MAARAVSDNPQAEIGPVEIGILAVGPALAGMAEPRRLTLKGRPHRRATGRLDPGTSSGPAGDDGPASQPQNCQRPSSNAAKPSGRGRPWHTSIEGSARSVPAVPHRLYRSKTS